MTDSCWGMQDLQTNFDPYSVQRFSQSNEICSIFEWALARLNSSFPYTKSKSLRAFNVFVETQNFMKNYSIGSIWFPQSRVLASKIFHLTFSLCHFPFRFVCLNRSVSRSDQGTELRQSCGIAHSTMTISFASKLDKNTLC